MPELKPLFSLPDAKDLILDAALAAFAQHGFHGASMRDIAARAGVSQSLVHHHFGSKDALWNFVGERISADFLDYMAETILPETPVEESVSRALSSYMAYWQEHPAAFRFNLWRLLEGPKGEREARSAALNSRIVPVFKRAQEAGLIRDDMPAGLAMIIGGSLIQFWLHSQIEIYGALAVTGDEPPTNEAFIEQILNLIRPRKRDQSGRRGKRSKK